MFMEQAAYLIYPLGFVFFVLFVFFSAAGAQALPWRAYAFHKASAFVWRKIKVTILKKAVCSQACFNLPWLLMSNVTKVDIRPHHHVYAFLPAIGTAVFKSMISMALF